MIRKKHTSVISLDLGTSSVRACLINHHLKILFQTHQEVGLQTNISKQAEQDPNEIVRASVHCLMETLNWAKENGHSPIALSFSNAVSSLVCLDSDFNPLRLALTYADLRADQEAAELIETYGSDYFKRNATPIHASYWLPKFLWLKKHDSNYPQYRYFCTIKDLLVFQLTGEFVIDFSNAVATGMCDVDIKDWDSRLLEIANLNKDQLPEINSTLTKINPQLSDRIHNIHLPSDFKFILGATDGVLSSLGAGAYQTGQVTTMIGSSGACRIAADSPLTSRNETRAWSYPLDDEIWIRGGAMNSGGLVTKWLVENFSDVEIPQDHHYKKMFDAAAAIEPGSNDLIFLPYLFGERAPIYDENARGVYFGLHSRHHRAHLARAGLEGILYALFSIYHLIHSGLTEKIEVRATGGYVQSELMLQIQADIFNLPVQIPSNYEGSALGAAILTFKALGVINAYAEITDNISIEKVYQPDSKNSLTYQKGFKKFMEVYQHLKPVFDQVRINE